MPWVPFEMIFTWITHDSTVVIVIAPGKDRVPFVDLTHKPIKESNCAAPHCAAKPFKGNPGLDPLGVSCRSTVRLRTASDVLHTHIICVKERPARPGLEAHLSHFSCMASHGSHDWLAGWLWEGPVEAVSKA